MRPIKIRLHVNRRELSKGKDAWPWIIHTSRACTRARKVRVCIPMDAEYHPERRNPKLFLTGYGYVHDMGNGEFVVTTGA